MTADAAECTASAALECDCVAYGSFSADNPGFGKPTPLSIGGADSLKKVTFGTNFLWAAGVPLPLMNNCLEYATGTPTPTNNFNTTW